MFVFVLFFCFVSICSALGGVLHSGELPTQGRQFLLKVGGGGTLILHDFFRLFTYILDC